MNHFGRVCMHFMYTDILNFSFKRHKLMMLNSFSWENLENHRSHRKYKLMNDLRWPTSRLRAYCNNSIRLSQTISLCVCVLMNLIGLAPVQRDENKRLGMNWKLSHRLLCWAIQLKRLWWKIFQDIETEEYMVKKYLKILKLHTCIAGRANWRIYLSDPSPIIGYACHLLTHWIITFSKLDWCDPGVWRCQLKICWCLLLLLMLMMRIVLATV